jgi:alpha-1,2-mannosyltransferase
VAIVALVAIPGTVILAAAAAGTLGFDFLSYHQAAVRVLAGERLYDPSVQQSGGFGLFYYPPPFALAVLPLGLLEAGAATWAWLCLSIAMLITAIWMLPVGRTVRWTTLLLAGLSWPVAYALKLGQVGPLLLLLFAVGWRWLDRPTILGGAVSLGAIVKIQPGILLGWALLTRRWLALVVGIAILAGTSLVATLVLGGTAVWWDLLALLGNVADPITTPHNFTPGAAAYQAGFDAGVAAAIQFASTGLVIVLVVGTALALRADASYLVAVVASQLLSPILWDHYAMLLLLPTAWLLERRQWWALLVPLATSVVVLFVSAPAVLYPLAFWAALIGVTAVGWRERRAAGESV